MYAVDLYGRVRRACHVDGMSKSVAWRLVCFGIDRKTVGKILKHSVPPGYRRSKPPARPKLDPFIAIIDQILEDDQKPAEEAAAYGEADLRAACATSTGSPAADDRHRLRAGEEAPDARGVRAAVAPARSCAGGFWRGARRDRRGQAQAALLRDVACRIRMPSSSRPIRPRRPRRSAMGMSRPSPSSAVSRCRSLRQHHHRGGEDPRRWNPPSALGPSRSCSRITCSRIGSVDPARATTRGHVEGTIGLGRRNFLVPMPRCESFEALNALAGRAVPQAPRGGVCGATARRSVSGCCGTSTP